MATATTAATAAAAAAAAAAANNAAATQLCEDDNTPSRKQKLIALFQRTPFKFGASAPAIVEEMVVRQHNISVFDVKNFEYTDQEARSDFGLEDNVFRRRFMAGNKQFVELSKQQREQQPVAPGSGGSNGTASQAPGLDKQRVRATDEEVEMLDNYLLTIDRLPTSWGDMLEPVRGDCVMACSWFCLSSGSESL